MGLLIVLFLTASCFFAFGGGRGTAWDESRTAVDARISALLETKRFECALSLCDSLEAEGFHSPRLISQKARVLAGLGRYDEALPLFEKAIVADYENCENHLDFAVFLMKNHKIGRAITEFRVAERFCTGINREIALRNLAVASLETGRLDDASRYADEGLGSAPDDYELLMVKAMLLREKSPAKAETLCVRAMGIKDDDPRLVYQYGAFLLENHRESEALPLLERAWRLEPGSVKVGISLAEALIASGKADEALEVIDSLNGADAGGAEKETGELKARALFALGRYALALAELEKQPLSPYTMDRMAMCLYHLGRNDEALELERKAIASRPRWVQPLINYAAILASMGRLDEAESALEKALSIEPENTTASENLRRIKKAETRSR